MDRSPCVECEFGAGDKNSRRCMECDDRVEYVSGLVGRSHSTEKAIKNEHRTSNVQHRMLNEKDEGRAAVKPQAKTGENKMTILEEKVEEIIKEICDEFGIDVARLKAGGCGRGTMYAPARKKIAERLIANYGMSKKKIGELTGVSVSAIFYILKRGQEKTTDAVDILHKRYIGDDPERKASLQTERGKTKPKPEKTVTIDFSEHAEILERLEKYAKEEIRSVPDQILYLIQTGLSWVEGEAERLEG